MYLHPILHVDGDYPQIVKERIANRSKQEGFTKSRLPQFTSEEVSYIRGTADFLGVNHYTSEVVLVIEEPAISDPSYNYDKGYYSYKNDSWPGSASAWLKVCTIFTNKKVIAASDGFRWYPKVFVHY